MYVKNGHKTHVQEQMHVILTTSLKNINSPLNKMSYTNSPPKNDYSYIKTTSSFCHE